MCEVIKNVTLRNAFHNLFIVSIQLYDPLYKPTASNLNLNLKNKVKRHEYDTSARLHTDKNVS